MTGALRAFALTGALAVACGGGNQGQPDAAPAEDAEPIDAPSGNATLAALTATVGVLDPPFEPEVTEYDLDLVLTESEVAFSPTAAAPDGTTITVDGSEVTSGSSSITATLTPGSRDVDLVVASEGGATATYRVHVHCGVDALASLVPDSGTLDPSFDPALASYEMRFAAATAALTWTPTAFIPARATITVEGAVVPSGSSSSSAALGFGDHRIPVVVTPLTRAPRTYEVDVLRGYDALASIALAYSGGALPDRLVPTFDPTTSTYAIDVGLWLDRLQVIVSPLDPGATITVDGGPAISGTPTAPIALDLGLTVIPIVLTAPDKTERIYALNVTRAGSVLQQAYAKASNPSPDDGYGSAVAMWGDTLAVAAPAEFSAATGIDGDQADNTTPGSGAVYVFTRSGAAWSQQAYVKASNTEPNDGFGQSVALWGDTLAVGASREDSAATGVGGDQSDNSSSDSGAVYVFTRTGTIWSQQAYLKASNTGADDRFGTSVSLWGDTVAVGAAGERSAATGVDADQADNTATDSGAVYVFTRTGLLWSQQAYLKASNTEAFDEFGRAIALWGETLAVGAIGEDSASTGVGGDQANNSASGSGAVYAFTRTGTTWSQQTYVKASNAESNDVFGVSVALSSDTLAVAAIGEDSASTDVGGDETDNAEADSGAVYVFTRTGITWSQHAYLKASNTTNIGCCGDEFGRSIALWGDTVAVGARWEDSASTGIGGNPADNSAGDSGAVYVFTRTGSTWSPQTYVKASNAQAMDELGWSLALWGDTLAVGAIFEASAATGVDGNQADNTAFGTGAVYVFR